MERTSTVLQRIERKIENMSAMLTLFGIDPAVFAQVRPASLFTTSVRACQTCPNGEICSAWLAQAGPIDRVPEFCPNAARFAHVKMLLTPGTRRH